MYSILNLNKEIDMAYRNCVVCGVDTGKIGNVKFCSDECRKVDAESKGKTVQKIEWKRKAQKNYTAKNKEKLKMIKQSYRLRLKHKVLSHYSDVSFPRCKRCGESDVDTLNLDHINDDGAKDRKKLGIAGRSGQGTRSYEAYSAEGYPEGLQVLCASCNLKKEVVRKRNLHKDNPFFEQYILNDERIDWLKDF